LFISQILRVSEVADGAIGMVQVISAITGRFYVRLMDSSPGEGLEGWKAHWTVAWFAALTSVLTPAQVLPGNGAARVVVFVESVQDAGAAFMPGQSPEQEQCSIDHAAAPSGTAASAWTDAWCCEAVCW
jgi:hypothetical protein